MITNIKERLKEYLLEKGLNSKSFALKIGVQPSSISHILTGRNKPSVELLEKLLKSFPDADIKYLITGIKTEVVVPDTSLLTSGNTDIHEGEEREFSQGKAKGDTIVTSKTQGGEIIVLFSDGTFREFSPR